jgi:hypothetical protein
MDEYEEAFARLFQNEDKKKKRKKKIVKWLLSALASIAPILIIIFMVVFIGSGIMSVVAAVTGFIGGIFGKTDTETVRLNESSLEDLTLEELIDLVEGDRIDPSFYDIMLINQEEFLYLLEEVQEYNTSHVTQTISIETRHKYLEWVWDETYDEDGNRQGHYEPKLDYPYRSITVDSADIEQFQLDWQLVYILCLSNTMNDIDSWTKVVNDDGAETMVHYGISHARIDDIIEAVSMKYEYQYDLARSEKTSYTMEECEAMVHTPYQYGDPDTVEGEWIYYIPHSVLNEAYSEYSVLYYLTDETGQYLSSLITAADMDRFDATAARFSVSYNYGYMRILLGQVPGGKKILAKLDAYDAARDTECVIKKEELNYVIGSGVDKEQLPTSKVVVGDHFEELGYEDIEYDGTKGSEIVRAARRQVAAGAKYSQDSTLRWSEGWYDCSSFVWRMLGECGISLGSFCKGSTAAAICQGMVESGMVISPSEIQPGDIIFYSSSVNGRYRNVTHTAIYAGDGKIVHARGKAWGVCESNYYTTGLVCVCRPY